MGLAEIFSDTGFMPHGHCFLWNPWLIRLHVVSDATIALAYTSIPFTLAYFVHKRKDLPFSWVFRCFGMFIISCGATHVMDIVTLWRPDYWAQGFVKAYTAVVSLTTAVLLVRLIPRALKVPGPDELAAADQAMKEYAADLERTNRALKDFGYSVAHDLRAPIRTIVSFSELMEKREPSLSAESRDFLARVKRAGDRLGLMLDGLLALGHLSQHKPVRETVDLGALASQRLDELAAQEPARRVALEPSRGVSVEGDPRLLAILMQNLVDNAWKFTRERADARIEIGRVAGGRPTRYFVRDNGRGFEPDQARHLFRPFHRLPNAKDVPGMGVGLASATRIVEAHGGRIWAEATPGGGAAFYFTLGDA